jgi:hypothetical protein
MNMQTTIADFVLSNPANQDVDKTTFETGLDFDSIITDAEPTLVYVKNNIAIAWYEQNAMVGFK